MLKVIVFYHLLENLVINRDAAKIASKRVVQNTAEATRDLIGNKIADKITSIGKPKEEEKPKEKLEEIYIPPEKRQQKIDDLR